MELRHPQIRFFNQTSSAHPNGSSRVKGYYKNRRKAFQGKYL